MKQAGKQDAYNLRGNLFLLSLRLQTNADLTTNGVLEFMSLFAYIHEQLVGSVATICRAYSMTTCRCWR